MLSLTDHGRVGLHLRPGTGVRRRRQLTTHLGCPTSDLGEVDSTLEVNNLERTLALSVMTSAVGTGSPILVDTQGVGTRVVLYSTLNEFPWQLRLRLTFELYRKI